MGNVKEYCIIALENVLGLKNVIDEISLVEARYVTTETNLVATFYSELTPTELSFKVNPDLGRSYFLFILNPELSHVNITKDYIHDFLFSGFDKLYNELDNDDKNDSIGDITTNMNNGNKIKKLLKKEITTKTKLGDIVYDEEKLKSYDKQERDMLMDELLDKIPNLTDNDKKILNFLNNL